MVSGKPRLKHSNRAVTCIKNTQIEQSRMFCLVSYQGPVLKACELMAGIDEVCMLINTES